MSFEEEYKTDIQLNTLSLASSEFQEQSKLLNNETVNNISIDLFEEAYKDIFGSERRRKLVYYLITQTFHDLVAEFWNEMGLNSAFDDNELADEMCKMIRMIDFFYCYRAFLNGRRSGDYETTKNIIESNTTNIVEFIRDRSWFWEPNTNEESRSYDEWAVSFNKVKKRASVGNNRKNYESYYAKGIIQIIRTMTNRTRHEAAFSYPFKTDFDFHLSERKKAEVYSIAVYAFVELVTVWADIKPFMQEKIKTS